ncbi:MAG: nucleoside recognition domain-containing protein [Deferribacterales bacterium]
MLKLVSELLKETYNICKTLFRIMIPVIIAVKVLSELGVIKILSSLLNPFMKVIGLPGELGLAWATALFTNIYGGIIVFISLSEDLSLNVAQATIFSSIVLIAHSMPVELQIMRKSGPRLRAMLVLRMGGALVYGWLLNFIYTATNTLQEPLRILWVPPVREDTLSAWAMGEVKNLLWITCIIFTLVAVMRLLHALGLMKLMENLLGPVLRFLGVSARASTLTIFGLTIGLSYAGGMIINEARSGKLSEADIFFSVSLLGLCHSLIEDTLLLMVVGGHLSGIFWGRIAFSIIVVVIIQRIIRVIKPEYFHKVLFLPSGN